MKTARYKFINTERYIYIFSIFLILTILYFYYVKQNNLDLEVRFDVISIIKHKGTFDIQHIENAFYHF